MKSTIQLQDPGAGPAGAGAHLVPLTSRRARLLKPAYTTRYVHGLVTDRPGRFGLLCGPDVAPRAGDVVLARVGRLGQHPRLESPASRRTTMYPGDEILVAYGSRYAPDQFEAEVPDDLSPTSLVAAGGVAGRVVSAHAAMAIATQLEPLGLLADSAGVVTLQRVAPYRLHAPDDAPSRLRHRAPQVVCVVGTSMNSGKTTAVAAVVRGLTRAGFDVAAGKVTGTGAGGDLRLFQDSGAAATLDFTDYGYASTYGLPPEDVRGLFLSMIEDLTDVAPDLVVLEVADGLYQRETAALVQDPVFQQGVDRLVFAAGEALGASAGLQVLAGHGLAPVAVTGLMSASPLTRQEAAASLGVPVVGVADLAAPGIVDLLGIGDPAPALDEAGRERVAG